MTIPDPLPKNDDDEPNTTTNKTMRPRNPDAEYWWATIGHNLQSALSEAAYPAEIQARFLHHFRAIICPHMGRRMYPGGPKSTICPDGSPFHCSFEFKESQPEVVVRCSLDLRTGYRQQAHGQEQGPDATQQVIAQLGPHLAHFDRRWFDSLSQSLGSTDVSGGAERQTTLFSGSSSSSSSSSTARATTVVGFDVHRTRTDAAPLLPANLKVTHFAAAAAARNGITPWAALRTSILQLPAIETHPNFLRGLELLETYMTTTTPSPTFPGKPAAPAYQAGALALSTDLTAPPPTQARLKLYLFPPSDDFAAVWDYYTLGGRIPGLEGDRGKFAALMMLLYGSTSPSPTTSTDGGGPARLTRRRILMYFSLSAHCPYPDPKIYFYVPDPNGATDESYLRGLDRWLEDHGWASGDGHDGKRRRPLVERVRACFDHRPLSQGTGIFLCVGLGRKGNDRDGELSMQVYLTPELGEAPVATFG
ncbi:aromatic prenyltransferase [Aspergillus indologenus CBS 114.80]|uniref:Aromatic prenyltransferase n=1 Tax=Aspergillus indologenus CBS 114.80 TaxID=1450541 RepID=A0A2V5HM95_9EURO|nr:aromatic prenyltransferase [Aspergillus indologenus CBS 114.80]